MYRLATNSSDGSATSTRLTPESNSDNDTQSPVGSRDVENSYPLQHISRHGSSKTTSAETEHEGEEKESFLRPAASHDVEHGSQFSDAEESAVLKKLDRRLVSFMALLYMLSFLDRSSMFPGQQCRTPKLTTSFRHWQREDRWP